MLTLRPSDGSVPTMQELRDQQKAAHEEHDRKSKEEIERALRR
jgi:hypothetical protein